MQEEAGRVEVVEEERGESGKEDGVEGKEGWGLPVIHPVDCVDLCPVPHSVSHCCFQKTKLVQKIDSLIKPSARQS